MSEALETVIEEDPKIIMKKHPIKLKNRNQKRTYKKHKKKNQKKMSNSKTKRTG